MKIRYSISVIILLLPIFLSAQTTVFEIFKSKRKIAEHYYKKKDYHTSLLIYNSILDRNRKDTTILLKAARANKKVGYYKESYNLYSQLRDTTVFALEDVLNMGELLLIMDKTEEANKWLRAYAIRNPNDMRIQNKLQKLNQKDLLTEDSLSYVIGSAPFNTEYSEFYPVLVNKDLIFLSNQPVFSRVKMVNSDNSYFFEIYKAPDSDKNHNFELFHKQLSGKFHVGPFCFMENGKKLILTLTDSKTKKLKLCFAEAKANSNSWKINGYFPHNSKKYSVGHPFYNDRDSTLYFVSDMEGGIGGTDIYKSQLKNGKWEEPVNLGRPMNSEGNEMFPYIFNGKFYFASDGHRGLGGLDIFYTELSEAGFSGEVNNAGMPVNSEGDDFAIFYSSPNKGYFSSNRTGGKGMDDIYTFSCLNSRATAKVNEFNGTPLAGARIAVTENKKHTVKDVITGRNGEISFDIKPGKTYKVHFEKEGYKPVDSVFSTGSEIKNEYVVSARLERKNKAFIKGVIKNDAGFLKMQGRVKVVNQQTGHVDTTSINSDGEFFAQVDPDYNYIFLVMNESQLGLKSVKNLPKKKGAFVSIVEMNVQSYTSRNLVFTVKDSVTGKSLENAYLTILNKTTGEKEVKETDKSGNFTYEVTDKFDYVISANCNDLVSGDLTILKTENKNEFILIIK